MAQEQKAKEPSISFRVKAGLPQAPQVRDVEVAEGDLKPWDLDSWSRFEQVGKRHTRFEAPLKVTGRAKYTYDVKLPGMLYGRMIGASIAAGEIVAIDTSRAEALPGVKAVWTADARTVRFAGQDVAAVAAVSPQIAEDAARLVAVSYREKPFAHELRAAMKKDAALVFAEAENPAGKDVTHEGNVGGTPPSADGARGTSRRPGERLRGGRCRRRGDLLLPRSHALLPRDARGRGLLGGRPAHGLRFDPGHLRRTRGARRGTAASTARTCASSASTWAAASAASSGPRRAATPSRWSPASWRRRPGRRSG